MRGAVKAALPLSGNTQRWKRRVTACMFWDTNNTVRPVCPSWSILSRHSFWNAASPTASTSSTIRIAGSKCAAMANGPLL